MVAEALGDVRGLIALLIPTDVCVRLVSYTGLRFQFLERIGRRLAGKRARQDGAGRAGRGQE